MLPSPFSSYPPRKREPRDFRHWLLGPRFLRGRRIGLSAGFPDTCSRGDGNLAHAAVSSVCRQAEAAVPRRGIGAPRLSITPSRLSRLCTGRNSSTYGIIAFIPRDLGSKPS